jgi:glycosyltransferase involved in cell wall biosynthesis
VPIEAFACGTPVIALSEGGYRETVIDGRNGFLLGNSSSEWAACLESLSKNPSRYVELCRNARRDAVEGWKWSAFWNRFDSVARKLIHSV